MKQKKKMQKKLLALAESWFFLFFIYLFLFSVLRYYSLQAACRPSASEWQLTILAKSLRWIAGIEVSTMFCWAVKNCIAN